MGAGMFDLLSGDVWHSGWWCGKDVGLVFGEEMVNHLLYVICVAMVNGLPCYKDGHPLLLEHSMTFLRCIMIMRGAFDSIYDPLMIRILSFLLKRTLKFIRQMRSGTSFQHG